MSCANVIRTESHQKPAAEVVAKRYSTYHIHSGSIFAFSQREGSRYDHAAGVSFRYGLEVIRLVRVCKHTGGESCIDGGCLDVRCGNGGFGDASLCPHVANRHLARFESSAGHNRCQCIENAVLGRLHDGRWKFTIARANHVSRELTRYVSGGLAFLCWRERRSGYETADALQCLPSVHDAVHHTPKRTVRQSMRR